MTKKIKGVILDSTTSYGVGLCVDNNSATIKYQTLVQDYHELQKEADMMRSRLEAGKQRKMILAAEVGFLRKRFGFFMKTKTMNLSQKEKLLLPSNLLKQMKHTTEISRREANLHMLMLPSIPETRPKKKQRISKEEAVCGTSPFSQNHTKMLGGLSTLSALASNTATVCDLNKKESKHAHDTAPRNTSAAFDLNQGNSSSVKELSMSSRAPIFDLNEISTGDEDFQTNAEEARGNEMQNGMVLSVYVNIHTW